MQDRGVKLSIPELDALNNWLYRLILESAGPPIPHQNRTWNKSDIIRVLCAIDKQLASAWDSFTTGPGVFRSSKTWQAMMDSKPELIVVCIKAGAFKEIEDE